MRATEEGLVGRNVSRAQERTPKEGMRTDKRNDTTEELNNISIQRKGNNSQMEQ